MTFRYQTIAQVSPALWGAVCDCGWHAHVSSNREQIRLAVKDHVRFCPVMPKGRTPKRRRGRR